MHDTSFAEVPLGLGAVLAERGFTELTPIQAAILDPSFDGRDLQITSHTGSGKTVALGLVMAGEVASTSRERDPGDRVAYPVALVVAPTRELAVQLEGELAWLLAPLGATVASLTGGTSLGLDFRALARDPQVLVGTPGRLRDHLERGSLRLDRVRVAALDEADEMLAMGFEEEVAAILEATPDERRTVLVSATFPSAVQSVARRHQRDPLMVAGNEPGAANEDIAYETVIVPPARSLDALVNLLLLDPEAKTLVFVRTRDDSARLAEALADLGFAARALSGDLNQKERTATLNAFRRSAATVLVATDVAARGLDVHDIAQVVHVGLPDNPEVLTHRSGRTGRAGRKGRSVVFVAPRAARRVETMLRQAGVSARRVEVPTPADVRRAAEGRLVDRLAGLDVRSGAEGERLRRVAAELLAERDPLEVVAALLGEIGMDGPCAPHEVPVVPEAREPRPRPAAGRASHRGGGDWARFQVSWGEHQGADARRLLAMVCRRGGISSTDVGAISVGSRSSMVEVNARIADAFARAVSRPDERDPRVRFREWREQAAARPRRDD